MFGISAALTTPFTARGLVDQDRLNAHIKAVLAEGCSCVTFFGTTGEGASVGANERLAAINAAIKSGINPAKMVLCLHGAAMDDVIDQVSRARELGLHRFMLAPPCYFGDATDIGLKAWFDTVLSRFDETDAEFILYHIPQVIGVGLSVNLIRSLKGDHPKSVVGVKDSSGSAENTRQLLQLPGLEILVGDERQLAACAKIGAAGSISGVANLFAGRLQHVLDTANKDDLIDDLVNAVLKVPVTAAIKSLVAHKHADQNWRRTLPPLVALSDTEHGVLAASYDRVKANPVAQPT